MGAVYLAVHQTLNTKKAVKVLLPEYSRQEVIRQRFEREARAASGFGNPHIVAIDDFGSLPDGQLFLTMPFLSGKPLDVHIGHHGRLSQHHTLQIIVQVCDALKTLHDAGIVHRDLKPSNILISETPDNAYHVTIIDFGIARIARLANSEDLAIKTRTGIAMGTPGYMAVEQFCNAGSAGATADLYAAAIITWEMLTGQTPWGFHDPRVLYHLQMTTVPTPPTDAAIPSELLSLLRKTLSPAPADRPATAQMFAGAFASLTPAIPPHVPSGAEILGRYAKRLVEHVSPDLETVRIASANDRSGPLLWPYRGTAVPELAAKGSSPRIVSNPRIVSSARAVASARRIEVPRVVEIEPPMLETSSGPTVNVRKRSMGTATTAADALGGPTVVTPVPTIPRSPRRSTLALLALAGFVLAGVITFALVHLRRSTAGTDAQHEAIEPR
ncbi:MAG: serine/threonine protein kinase [Kofleriaceae bacterium]|nr:serine/threonine protein kinase [Kofleriaceae bacterium]